MPGTEGEMKQLPLELDATTETPALRDLTPWERMLADYRHTSMSIETHPLALLRAHLPDGTLSSVELHDERHGRQVAFAGMTVARQRPSTAKGVVFMLLEDEHGQVNLIVPSAVYEQHRATVRAEPLILARGRYERVGENRNVLVSRPGGVELVSRTRVSPRYRHPLARNSPSGSRLQRPFSASHPAIQRTHLAPNGTGPAEAVDPRLLTEQAPSSATTVSPGAERRHCSSWRKSC